jgi:hypothetical protein
MDDKKLSDQNQDQGEAGKELSTVTAESPRPAQGRRVNPNAVWDSSRCGELDLLERLVREVKAINGGNRCLERIASCIEMAEQLDRTTYEPVRRSFLSFLNDIAIDDRFGSDNAPERDAEN